MTSFLGYYVHQLDPFIFRITETFGPRWYGLAYLLAFIVGILFLRFLARRGYGELKEEQVTDFIVYTAILGVMLGGRLGYFLFYRPNEFFENPLVFFKFLEGGMASHGGILGIVFFTLYYAKRHRLSWPGLGDNLVVIAPMGIFFGRIANFINGELYGRKTEVAWAVQFPEELRGGLPPETVAGVVQQVDSVVPGKSITDATQVIEAAWTNPDVIAVLAETLTPRHPSQIYQALLEGLLITLILLPIRLRWKALPHGILTGLFFILYAIFRMLGERFREPDAERILTLTRGQFYSTFMILIGLAFIFFAIKRRQSKAHATAS